MGLGSRHSLHLRSRAKLGSHSAAAARAQYKSKKQSRSNDPQEARLSVGVNSVVRCTVLAGAANQEVWSGPVPGRVWTAPIVRSLWQERFVAVLRGAPGASRSSLSDGLMYKH